MGLEFIPTLVCTVNYEAIRWDDLRELLSDEFLELAEKGDVETIYRRIKVDCEGEPEEIKKRVRNFIGDLNQAGGVVAIYDKTYQEVVEAILIAYKV